MKQHPKTAVWYYRKTVPEHLRPHLPAPHTGKWELLQSLGHKDKQLADREHVRVSEIMERVLDQARIAYVKATTPETPRKPLSPYEQTLAAMAEEDDFNISLDLTTFAPGLRSIPVGGAAADSVLERPSQPVSEKKADTISSVFEAYARERKLSKDVRDEYMRSLTYFGQHSGQTMETDIHRTTKAMRLIPLSQVPRPAGGRLALTAGSRPDESRWRSSDVAAAA